MTDEETDFEESASRRKPRKQRKRNEDPRAFVSRIINGEPMELASFPQTAVGTPIEERITSYVKDMYGGGTYRIDIKLPNGRFKRSFEISIATEPERFERQTERDAENIVDVEPEEFDDEPEDFSYAGNTGQMNAVEVENLLLKERLRRFEDELSRQKTGNQSEMQTLISALEESRREQRELMMTMLSQSQKPQQDATTQAMNLLEKSFGMVTKARAISDELAPPETSSSGTYLGDAANLINALGQNAGKFLPLLLNRSTAPAPTVAPRTAKPKATNGNGNGNQTGELSDLLAKVKNKKEGEGK